MNPDVLLSRLVQAYQQSPPDHDTPFLLETTNQATSPLMHPMLPGGGLLLDAPARVALETLVQWGYLSQPEEYGTLGYVLTPAGLDYAARQDGTISDGTERHQQERRTGRREPFPEEPRRVDRRQAS